MSTFDLLWPLWVALLAVSFGLVEGWALYEDKHHPDQPGHTLSAHVRRWCSLKTHLGRTVFIVVWSVVTATLLIHFTRGGWF